jgi:hypothetical protein
MWPFTPKYHPLLAPEQRRAGLIEYTRDELDRFPMGGRSGGLLGALREYAGEIPVAQTSDGNAHDGGFHDVALSARCAKVKKRCLERCSDLTLETNHNDGWPFYECVDDCLVENGCPKLGALGGDRPEKAPKGPRTPPRWRK